MKPILCSFPLGLDQIIASARVTGGLVLPDPCAYNCGRRRSGSIAMTTWKPCTSDPFSSGGGGGVGEQQVLLLPRLCNNEQPPQEAGQAREGENQSEPIPAKAPGWLLCRL